MLYLLLTMFGLAAIGWAVSLFMSAREVRKRTYPGRWTKTSWVLLIVVQVLNIGFQCTALLTR